MTLFARKIALAVGASLIALSTAMAEEVKITFVLANDTDEANESKGRGGLPRLAAAVKAERAANENTLFVHAGDVISPSLLSGFDQGAHMITLLNMISPDIFVPGNHEYDFGPDVADARLAESEFPWIAANITQADGSPIEGIEPTMMKEVAGIKIGFIGLGASSTPVLSSPGDLQFADPYETAKARAAELKEAGAEFVVAVNHNERHVGQRLIDDAVVDMLTSGHNHDLWLFYNGRGLAMEATANAGYIPSIDINFTIEEEDGKRDIDWRPNVRIIDSATLTPDAEVAAKVEMFEAALDEELNVEIGTTAVELDTRRASVRSGETVFGSLVADAMKEAVGADIGLTNGGGIRGDTQYPAGSTITRKIVLTELPFGNRTVLLELTGAQVREALENGVSKIEETAGRFPHVSGISFAVDRTKPAGERISDLMINGAPLDDAASYKLATNDYMANGGDGYSVLRDGKVLIDSYGGKLMANHVMAHIRAMGEVTGGGEPRIMMK